MDNKYEKNSIVTEQLKSLMLLHFKLDAETEKFWKYSQSL